MLGKRPIWFGDGVGERFGAPAADPTKAQGGGKDRSAPLPRLDRSRDEAPSVTHPLDVVEDGDLGVPRENKVAVHAMDDVIGRDSSHGGGQGLSDGSAPVDPAGPGRMP